jgi:hypothetical protein
MKQHIAEKFPTITKKLAAAIFHSTFMCANANTARNINTNVNVNICRNTTINKHQIVMVVA